MTFKLYFAQAIDQDIEKARRQQREFADILKKDNVEVYGAGFSDSPIVTEKTSKWLKDMVIAHDLRQIRECDMFLLVTDGVEFTAGTMMELEYARQLGLYCILYWTGIYPIKNIFLTRFADVIVFDRQALEGVLEELQ